MRMNAVEQLNEAIVRCRKCPRLVRWREQVAKNPPPRYRGQAYWAKPLPGFGDPQPRLLVVGLAPAAHGGNRTGRIFTGDRSGDWLYGALYDCGFASQARSEHPNDGLKLNGCYITAAVRCAPPENKPSHDEFARCRRYLVQELKWFCDLRVVVALGKIAFDAFLSACQDSGGVIPRPRPQFAHGQSVRLASGVTLMGCYHPSQQNTFTRKLTREMLHDVFNKARVICEAALILPKGRG
jgi:uracil-DNA glycosylase